MDLADDIEAFLECGIVAHRFVRLPCGERDHHKLLTFNCRRGGFRAACCVRNLPRTAAYPVAHVIP